VNDKPPGRPTEEDSPREPHRVRLPGFLIEEEIGLGDVIRKVTHIAGVAPCIGCERRATALNRWVRFSP
jgi:hypothetical protein